VGDVIIRVGLGIFGQGHQALGNNANFLTQGFSGNWAINNESLEPLIGLVFLVQKLWPRNN